MFDARLTSYGRRMTDSRHAVNGGRVGSVAASLTLCLLICVLIGVGEATQTSYSRGDYAGALTPVLESEFADETFPTTHEDAVCLARELVERFSMQRLLAMGKPAQFAAQQHLHFGVMSDREKRIAATVLWKCFSVGRMRAIGFQDRGQTLSEASIACLDEQFARDPDARDSVIDATMRMLQHRPLEQTEGARRAASILSSCLPATEKAAVASRSDLHRL
jgi:hypothetical protein